MLTKYLEMGWDKLLAKLQFLTGNHVTRYTQNQEIVKSHLQTNRLLTRFGCTVGGGSTQHASLPDFFTEEPEEPSGELGQVCPYSTVQTSVFSLFLRLVNFGHSSAIAKLNN